MRILRRLETCLSGAAVSLLLSVVGIPQFSDPARIEITSNNANEFVIVDQKRRLACHREGGLVGFVSSNSLLDGEFFPPIDLQAQFKRLNTRKYFLQRNAAKYQYSPQLMKVKREIRSLKKASRNCRSFGGLGYDSSTITASQGDSHSRVFKDLALGLYTVCGLTTDGIAYCWGRGDFTGLLGGNTKAQSQYIPIRVKMEEVQGGAFASLFVGSAHACGITPDHITYCWGFNGTGQIGNDTTIDQGQPVPINTSNMLSDEYFTSLTLSVAEPTLAHSCGLTNQGRILCWGSNSNGQLGTEPPFGNQYIPTQVNMPQGVSSFKFIDIGDRNSCAIATNNEAYCWGKDTFGAVGNNDAGNDGLGDPDVPSPAKVETSMLAGNYFTSIAVGVGTTCGVSSDRSVYCWGLNSLGSLGVPNTQMSFNPILVSALINQDVSVVSVGSGFSCAAKTNGSISCWGNDYYKQLGQGPNGPGPTDLTLLGADSIDLDAVAMGRNPLVSGGTSSCLLTRQGWIYCWGWDGYGQIGNDSIYSGSISRPTPITHNASPISFSHNCPTIVDELSSYSCQLSAAEPDGDLITFQLGSFEGTCQGVSLNSATGTVIWNTPASTQDSTCTLSFSVLDDYSIGFERGAQRIDVPVTIKSHTPQLSVSAIPFSAVVGENYNAPLAFYDPDGGPVSCVLDPEQTTCNWARIEPNSCTVEGEPLNSDASTTCTLAVTIRDHSIPVHSSSKLFTIAVNRRYSDMAFFTSVSVGNESACATTAAGHLYCWGRGAEIGTGDGVNRSAPVLLNVAGSNDYTVAQFSTNCDSCIVALDGSAYCWGANIYGEVGNGTRTLQLMPVQVQNTALNGELFSNIQAGNSPNTCALTTTGKAYCWGGNDYYSVGDGTKIMRLSPVRAASNYTFKSISVGGNYTCGVGVDNNTYCWGYNAAGQLGTGDKINSGPAIRQVVTSSLNVGEHFEKLASGRNHNCGLTNTNRLFCWGRNDVGQTGTGLPVNSSLTIPTLVKSTLEFGEYFTDMSLADASTCAITNLHHVYCWGGDNFYGQLGLGFNSLPSNLIPARIDESALDDEHFVTVSVNHRAGCATTDKGRIYCWGNNAVGKVGVGNFENINYMSPTLILMPAKSASTQLTLNAKPSFSAGLLPKAFSAGDYNLDGKLDLITANGDGTIQIQNGKGDGTFTEMPSVTSTPGITDLTLADNYFGRSNVLLALRPHTVATFKRGPTGAAFVPTTNQLADFGSNLQKIIALDLNRDNYADFVATDPHPENPTQGGIFIGWGVQTGAGREPRFSVPQFISVPGAQLVASGDLNNDGKLDLVITGNDDLHNYIYVLMRKNAPGLQWEALRAISTESFFVQGEIGNIAPLTLALADFSGDNRLDIAVGGMTNNAESRVYVLRNDGNGFQSSSWMTKVSNPFLGARLWPESMAVADFNKDGRADLILSGDSGYFNSPGKAVILLGNSSASFTIDTVFDIPTGVRSIKTSDFNKDGTPDVAALGNSAAIFLGEAL